VTSLNEKYESLVVEDEDDVSANPTANQPLIEVIEARYSRRSVLKGFAATAALGATGGALTAGGALTSRVAFAAGDPSTLTFRPPKHVILETHQVAEGYEAHVLIRWGDKVLADAPEWDPNTQSAEAQAKQFGYNCDFLAYMPLPQGSDNSEHGLIHCNHEYTDPQLMFASWNKGTQSAAQTRIEMMAHNGSVIEVRKHGGNWRVVEGSKYARRITLDTEMRISGPAAGHARLKTGYDPTGRRVFGTINNCAGGKTPWGTVLMAEENFHGYFGGGDPDGLPEARNYKRYGIKADARYPWYKTVDRFDIGKEPNEPNRFGWMVEYDPFDPDSTPVKRTALGRCKHEGATSIVNKDGRVVFYSGDDQRFDYLYKFVTKGTYDPSNRALNRDLLDQGTLYVAKFDEKSVTWLPLNFGEGPLTPENDFHSQADVLIETRRAADLVGATPMDRPEDVEPNPVNGRVYVMLTNNSQRKSDQLDAVNPRANNRYGQIVELVPPGGSGKDADHAADVFEWNMLLIGGRLSFADRGLALVTRQLCLRPAGSAVDLHRPGLQAGQGQHPRRHLCLRPRGSGEGAGQVLLWRAEERGNVRAGVHARWQNAFRGRPAPGRGEGIDLRDALDPLARFHRRRTAAAFHRRHHQGRWRPDRQLSPNQTRRTGNNIRGSKGDPFAALDSQLCRGSFLLAASRARP
jgi:secreted PhoX family phosphatase